MRTNVIRLAAVLGLACIATVATGIPTGSVSVEMLDHYTQTAPATVSHISTPYSFEFHLRSNGAVNMSTWAPVFSLPGGGSPTAANASFTQPVSSSNFSSSPNANSGSDYFYQANYLNTGSLTTDFPTGSYGINFGGAVTSGSPFSAGLTFSSGAFASVAPEVTGFNNGAGWSSGLLKVSTTGITTLNINGGSFSEYTTGIGSQIQAGLVSQSGAVIASSSTNYSTSLGYSDPAMTSFAIDGSLLTAGQSYTFSIQYGILASTPGSASLNAVTFQGVAEYFTHTDINITAIPEPSATAALLGVMALAGGLVYRRQMRR